ncbi:MAG: hypothetical protein E6J70_01315 [Deltaproteobacteria bacterium]|nr:MAG: hypothetical protein E6J70_01315 [Deltaproteobacteria bacterium]
MRRDVRPFARQPGVERHGIGRRGECGQRRRRGIGRVGAVDVERAGDRPRGRGSAEPQQSRHAGGPRAANDRFEAPPATGGGGIDGDEQAGRRRSPGRPPCGGSTSGGCDERPVVRGGSHAVRTGEGGVEIPAGRGGRDESSETAVRGCERGRGRPAEAGEDHLGAGQVGERRGERHGHGERRERRRQ